jgi:hypothetical protein
VSIIVSACASQPEELAAQYTSDLRYHEWSCKNLAQEATNIDRRLNELYGSLKEKAGDDQAQMAVGLILFWPALFLLEGGDGPQATEFSRLKGDREAIDRVSRFKDCSIIIPMTGPSAPQNSAIRQLKELEKLKADGFIGDTEFEEKRKKILDEEIAKLPSSGQQAGTTPKQSAPASGGSDGAVWLLIEHSTDPKHFEAYLKQFPDGVYAIQAKAKLHDLERARMASTTPSNRSVRGPLPHDGVWQGYGSCGEHQLPVSGGNRVALTPKVQISNGYAQLKLSIETEVYTGNKFSTISFSAKQEQVLSWIAEETQTGARDDATVSWKETPKSVGAHSVKIAISPPEKPTSAILLEVSGARDCKIKLSHKGA